MQKRGLLLACAAAALVAGCGGGATGGGGLNTTPPPVPAPPPPPPSSSITSLNSNENFASVSGTTRVVFDLGKDVTAPGTTTAASTVQVSYDAGTHSYTVTTQGRSQSFSPGDSQADPNPGETRYLKTSGGTSDYLTLATTPYSGTASNHYVGLGFWQHNVVSGDTQDTLFDIFPYGFETPATGVPKTGTVSWKTDVFGLLTTPGGTPRGAQGSGSFVADFLNGVFSTNATLDQEYDYITGGGLTGALELQGAGHLTSGNAFSGNFSYESQTATVGGTMSGKFYGPNADEIGASFSASDPSGDAFTGAMTGQRDSSQLTSNLVLTNILMEQRLYLVKGGIITTQGGGGSGFVGVNFPDESVGTVTVEPDGSHKIDLGTTDYPIVALTNAERVSGGRPNFDAYDVNANGQPVHVELYRPGASNSELALTYVSFGTWTSSAATTSPSGTFTHDSRLFFLYGLATPRDLLMARTGTGSYDGVVYGAGASGDGHLYDVGGTSHFDVNFGAQSYTGSLTLIGKEGNGATTSFGTWSFGNNFLYGQLIPASLSATAADPLNKISPQFFGPDGEEIGAVFKLVDGPATSASSVFISGVTVAKRH